jgi:hypothetical protein
MKLSIHATRKEDDTERDHTYKLSIFHVVELYAQPITAKKHAYNKEQQQGGHTKAGTRLTHCYADKQQNRTYKEDVS